MSGYHFSGLTHSSWSEARAIGGRGIFQPAKNLPTNFSSPASNPVLSQEIADYLGVNLAKVNMMKFTDGEMYAQLQESVRGCNVFCVQPISFSKNDDLMELLLLIAACREEFAKNITAVIPCFGYAKADKKNQGHESFAAKLVAKFIDGAGADRVLSCVHSGQLLPYFKIPIDHVYGQLAILHYLESKSFCSNDLVVVCLDDYGVESALAFAKFFLNTPTIIINRKFQGHNAAEGMNLDGDVRGKVAIVLMLRLIQLVQFMNVQLYYTKRVQEKFMHAAYMLISAL